MNSKQHAHSNGAVGFGDLIQDAVGDIKKNATDAFEKRVDSLGDLMKEHPLLAIGIGLSVGYLAARILRHV